MIRTTTLNRDNRDKDTLVLALVLLRPKGVSLTLVLMEATKDLNLVVMSLEEKCSYPQLQLVLIMTTMTTMMTNIVIAVTMMIKIATLYLLWSVRYKKTTLTLMFFEKGKGL